MDDEEKRNLEVTLADKNSFINKLQRDLRSLQSEKAALENDIGDYYKIIDDKESSLRKLKEDYNTLKSKCETLKLESKQLQHENTTKSDAIINYQDQLQKLNKRLEENIIVKKDLVQTEEENEKLKEKIQKFEEAMKKSASLYHKYLELETAHEDLKKQVVDQTEELINVKKCLAETQNDLQKQIEIVMELQHKSFNSTFEMSVPNVGEQLSSILEEELKSCQKEKTHLESLNQELNAQQCKLQSELTSVTKSKNVLEQEYQHCMGEKNIFEKQLENLKTEQLKIQKSHDTQLQSLQQEIDSNARIADTYLQEKIRIEDELSQRKTDFEFKINCLSTKISEMQESLQHKNKEIDHVNKLYDDQVILINELKSEMQQKLIGVTNQLDEERLKFKDYSLKMEASLKSLADEERLKFEDYSIKMQANLKFLEEKHHIELVSFQENITKAEEIAESHLNEKLKLEENLLYFKNEFEKEKESLQNNINVLKQSFEQKENELTHLIESFNSQLHASKELNLQLTQQLNDTIKQREEEQLIFKHDLIEKQLEVDELHKDYREQLDILRIQLQNTIEDAKQEKIRIEANMAVVKRNNDEEINSLQENIRKLQTNIDLQSCEFKQQVEDYKNQINEMNENETEMESEINHLTKELNEEKANYENESLLLQDKMLKLEETFKSKLIEKQVEFDELHKDYRDQLDILQKQLQNTIEDAKQERIRIEADMALVKRNNEEEINSLQERISKLQANIDLQSCELKQQIHDYEIKINQINENKSEMENEISHLTKKLHEEKENYENESLLLQDKMVKLEETFKNKLIARQVEVDELHRDYREQLDILQSQIKNTVEDGKQEKTRIEGDMVILKRNKDEEINSLQENIRNLQVNIDLQNREFKQQIDEYEIKISETNKSKSEMENEIINLTNKLQELKANYENERLLLENQMFEMEEKHNSELNTLQVDRDSAIASADTLLQKMQDTENALITNKRDFELEKNSLNAIIEELRKSLDSKNLEIENVTESYKLQLKTISKAKEELEDNFSEIKIELKETQASYNKTLAENQDEIKLLQENHSSKNLALVEKNNELQALVETTIKEKLQAETEMLQDKEKLLTKINLLYEDIGSMEVKNSELENCIDEYKSKLDITSSLKSELELRILELEKKSEEDKKMFENELFKHASIKDSLDKKHVSELHLLQEEIQKITKMHLSIKEKSENDLFQCQKDFSLKFASIENEVTHLVSKLDMKNAEIELANLELNSAKNVEAQLRDNIMNINAELREKDKLIENLYEENQSSLTSIKQGLMETFYKDLETLKEQLREEKTTSRDWKSKYEILIKRNVKEARDMQESFESKLRVRDISQTKILEEQIINLQEKVANTENKHAKAMEILKTVNDALKEDCRKLHLAEDHYREQIVTKDKNIAFLKEQIKVIKKEPEVAVARRETFLVPKPITKSLSKTSISSDYERHSSMVTSSVSLSNPYKGSQENLLDQSISTIHQASFSSMLPTNAREWVTCEDEEGEFHNFSYLQDMQKEICQENNKNDSDRIDELQRRNTLCLPHLRTSYPLETLRADKDYTEEDIKLGKLSSSSLQKAGTNTNKSIAYNILTENGQIMGDNISERRKTKVIQPSYRKPGPPTPGKSNKVTQPPKTPKQKTPIRNIFKRSNITPKSNKYSLTSTKSHNDENDPSSYIKKSPLKMPIKKSTAFTVGFSPKVKKTRAPVKKATSTPVHGRGQN